MKNEQILKFIFKVSIMLLISLYKCFAINLHYFIVFTYFSYPIDVSKGIVLGLIIQLGVPQGSVLGLIIQL